MIKLINIFYESFISKHEIPIYIVYNVQCTMYSIQLHKGNNMTYVKIFSYKKIINKLFVRIITRINGQKYEFHLTDTLYRDKLS